MSEVTFILVFGGVMLAAAWLVNALVGLLSGDHPRDTFRVWMDMLSSDWHWVGAVVWFVRPRWVRWILAIGLLFGAVYLITRP